MENIMLIKRNLQTEVRVALYGEVVEQNVCVCVAMRAGVVMRGWSLCCEGALGPRSWFSATPKMHFRVSELAGARGDPGVLVFSKMNKLFY